MWEYKVGHVIDVLRTMEPESVQCVVTSPPYWGLRKYAGEQEVVWGGRANPDGSPCQHDWGDILTKKNRWGVDKNVSEKQTSNRGNAWEIAQGCFCSKCGAWKGAFGLEPTIELYVQHTVEILREIKRVLRNDGVVFWNIGDCYAGSGGPGGDFKKGAGKDGADEYGRGYNREGAGLKPKDLVMVPARVALAVQADGWWVRSDIIWQKISVMPESVIDRPSSCYEHIFLFTKSERYFWDLEAVREPVKPSNTGVASVVERAGGTAFDPDGKPKGALRTYDEIKGANCRNVWVMNPTAYHDAHFATFPESLPRRAILAGTSAKGCCPTCGKPWVRIIENDNPSKEFFEKDDIGSCAPEGSLRSRQSNKSLHRNDGPDGKSKGVYSKTVVKGWKQNCECKKQEPIPCLVLDPFGGSGTTLKVARDLGRSAIAIDISKEYRKLAVKRAMLDVPDITRFGESD